MNNTIKTCVENLRSSLDTISIDKFVVDTLEVLMQIERKEYLMRAITDKGNGFYSRSFKTLTRNSMLVNIPRTRTGNFKPELIELIRISQEQTDHFCLSLYKCGMTTRDVEYLMKDFFGDSISHSKVSYLAASFNDLRQAWMNSSLEHRYSAVFCDCIFITVRRYNRYEKEAVYVCYGVREDGKRELLALDINPTESSSCWEDIFENIKERGVKDIDLVISDGLSGMRDVVMKCFPRAKHQSCVVHKMRNILRKVSPKEKAEIAGDLKEVFNNFDISSSRDLAITKCNIFVDKWSKKYDFSKYFIDYEIDSLFTYIDCPVKIRRMVYTTNSIESLNKIIKKGTKNKLSFESPDRLLDYIFMIVKDFEDRNWMVYPVQEFIDIKLTRHN